MKKVIFLMLSLLLISSLLACGEEENITSDSADETTEITSEASDKTTEENTEATTEEKTKYGARDDVVLSFDEGLLIVEDDNVTVKLAGVYQENQFVDDRELTVRGIILSVTNNGEHEFLFDIFDSYLQDERADSIGYDGNYGPTPGKTGRFSFDIEKESTESPIDKLSDLSDLNGKIELSILTDDGEYIEQRYTINFDLKDYKNQIDDIVNENIDYTIETTGKS